MTNMRANKVTILKFVAGLLVMSQAAAEETKPVASVDGTTITREKFELEVYNDGRQTFYHGRPLSESQVIEFRRSVAEKMVDRILLVREALRQGIHPDVEAVSARLAIYENRYKNSERWQAEGDSMMAMLRSRFENDSVLEQFERQVKNVEDSDEKIVRDYYASHPERFTEPEQIRVSTILLSVAPSAGGAAWEAARREAHGIVNRIKSGESFEELARLHSADASAKAGGDMGYLHKGMLSAAAQQALDTLQIDEISGPVTVLEGVAIFRLADRKEARLQTFPAVRDRATDLWRRDAGEDRWNHTVASLRSRSEISFDDDYLRTLPVARR